ncbi:MAG: hypothetical protein ABFD54_03065 [Armatimonadota bacterium]|nr:hypothetical protein [bacterium]
MTTRVIHYVLYLMQVRPKTEKQSITIDWLVFFIGLMGLAALSMVADDKPALGYGAMYLVAAVLPFIFGWMWVTNTFLAKDREEIIRRFNPTRVALGILMIAAVLGLIKVALDGVMTLLDYMKFVAVGTSGVFAIFIVAVYAPFFLGRYLSALRVRS